MPDGWEVRYELDPVTPSAELDTDNDGKTDLVEYKAGTDPTKKETLSPNSGSAYDSNLFIILGIVIVVVILGVLLGFMFLKKRKGDGQAGIDNATEPFASSEQSGYQQYPELQQMQQQQQQPSQVPQDLFYIQSELDYIPIQPPPYGQQTQYMAQPNEQNQQLPQLEVQAEYIPPQQVPGFVPQELYPNPETKATELKGSLYIENNNSYPYSYQ